MWIVLSGYPGSTSCKTYTQRFDDDALVSMQLNSIAIVKVFFRKAQLVYVPTYNKQKQFSLVPSPYYEQISEFSPQIIEDYLLNWSMLISGGKETNKDSPSNDKWSSSLKSLVLAVASFSLEKCLETGWMHCV